MESMDSSREVQIPLMQRIAIGLCFMIFIQEVLIGFEWQPMLDARSFALHVFSNRKDGSKKQIPPKTKKRGEHNNLKRKRHNNLKRKQDLTIVAIPSCGLGNRMRNVNGAALMATSMNAQMEILWVETMSHCHSKFSDLFGPIASPNVKVVEIRQSSAREREKSKYGRYNSLREIPNSVYCEGYCVKYKGSLAPGCKRCPWNRTAPVYEGKARAVVFGCNFCTYEGNSFNDQALLHHGMCAESLNMYTPPAEVQSVIKSLNISQEHTAGVHIRMGDKRSQTTNLDFLSTGGDNGKNMLCPSSFKNTSDIAEFYINGMKEFMRIDPAVKRFVLASDSREVVKLIEKEFEQGTIIHHQDPSNNTCSKTLALDLWSLASTKAIIGSYTSTFGYLAAALGQSKPVMYIESCSGKLTTGHYSDDAINDGAGHDSLASSFHQRVFCSSRVGGCASRDRRRLFDINSFYKQKYLSGGEIADFSTLLL